MTSKHYKSSLPLRGLQIFEAAARHQNFTAAGREIGVTQSAVSRKISELEAIIGTSLFRRSGPNLALTRTGRELSGRVSIALDGLSHAVADASSTANSNVVTLSMLPSVAAKWLAPRLGDFTRLHPQIDLRIGASRDIVNLTKEGFDGAIRYGLGHWSGLETVWLGSEMVQPVCAPGFIEKHHIQTPADLLKAPLLHADIAQDWAAWFAAAGLPDAKVPRGPKLGDDTAILQAALSGQGIVLGRSLLVADDLKSGRLMAPFTTILAASYSYWFVYSGPETQNLTHVKNWVFNEFRAYRRPSLT
jgi:LysR family glycine cleavage system transcriptional activator